MSGDGDMRTMTFHAEEAVEVGLCATEVVAGRYRLGAPLGAGGGGTVYAARDERTGRDVALKRMRGVGPDAARRARREVAALRYLRIPGVVQLLDDGYDGDTRFIVMPRLDGRPWFSGGACWEEIEGPLLALLDTLGRVHARGILHLDLKPGNVLIVDGRPFVLDFGIALGRALSTGVNIAEGVTFEFGSPEQRAGKPCDARSDLYSVGRMVMAALVGLREAATFEIAQPTRTRVPSGLPAHAEAVLTRLLAEDPAERPANAEEVIAALGGLRVGDRVAAVVARVPGDVDLAEPLRVLFRGPDVYHHLQEDGARLLFERTNGSRAAMGPELERWVRSGLAAVEGDEIVVDRLGLDRLSMPEIVGSDAEMLREAETRARALRDEGRHSLAIPTVELALGLARGLGDAEGERRLLGLLTEVALASEARAAVDAALYEVERSAASRTQVFEELLRAADASLRNDAAGIRLALATAEELAEDELEIWRMALVARADALTDHARAGERLRALAPWARGKPRREAKLARWKANLAYRRQRYGDAARLALASISRSRPDERLSALYIAAIALLETSPPRASVLGHQLLADARACRNPGYEVRATFIVRASAYRLHRREQPAPELVSLEAIAGFGHTATMPLLLCEASFAWRAGDRAVASALAERLILAATEAERTDVELLARALHAAARAPVSNEVLEDLASRAHICAIPEIAAQIYGLLYLAGQPRREHWSALARVWAQRSAISDLDRRLDVLSLREAVEGVEHPKEDPCPRQ